MSDEFDDGSPPPGDDDVLDRCEQVIGYQFEDRDLLRSALTHASGANHRLASNERLEFLGDSILGFIICEHLFQEFPEFLEGDLTKIKSILVSRRTCAIVSDRLGLEQFLVVGKGMATSSSLPDSLLADVFEAVVAAIYLDGGSDHARRFIMDNLRKEIDPSLTGDSGGNFKSLLQQYAQRVFGATPVYQLLDEKGPDHSKCFKVAAQVGGKRYASAWGKNKKEAEQGAARIALTQLRESPESEAPVEES